MKGAWPGGPPRSGDSANRTRPIRTMEQRIAGAQVAGQRRETRRRRAQFAALVASAGIAAAALGFVIGERSSQTAEEVTARALREQASDGMEGVLRSESSRIITEMWRTELLEAAR